MKIVVLGSHTLAAEASAWAALKKHGEVEVHGRRGYRFEPGAGSVCGSNEATRSHHPG